MGKHVIVNKTEILLLILTTIFLSGLLVFYTQDRRAEEVPGLTVETAVEVPQEEFVPEIKPVDLNRATLEELDTLPGIGEGLARRIIAYREEQGPFETVEELMEVSGIGEKKFAELESDVTVGGKD